MAERITAGLNTAQREAVTSSADVLQVLAPPGSGKTKTLTARVAHLLAHRHYKPWNIIVCTFTVKAATEMKERIRGFVGDEHARQLKLGTFHSISMRYLRQYGHLIDLQKDFGVADTGDSRAIVKRIIKQNDLSMDPNQARSRISTQKAKGIDSEQFASTKKNTEQQEFSQIYSEYQATLDASNLLDYDDLLLRCRNLLRRNPECVKNVEALLIDEFQDTNNIQYELMTLFAQHCNVVTIVGDPDQSIYGFRAAEIENLARMRKTWPDTLTINLEENYRSTGAILHAAQRIIEQDETRPPKKLQATHTFGLRPVLRKLPHAQGEAEWLVSEVKRLQALSGNMLRPNDFAVLLRSAALSRVIETALGQAGVPYRMVGGARFYDRPEIRLLLDYLRVIDTPGNSEALERIINVPARRIGEATVKILAEEARGRGRPLWEHVKDVTQGKRRTSAKLNEPARAGLGKFVGIILGGRKRLADKLKQSVLVFDLLNFVIQKLNFETYLSEHYKEDHESRWANVKELLTQAQEATDPALVQMLIAESTLPDIDGVEQQEMSITEDALSLFLANIALTAATTQKQEEEEQQQLTISTVHAAKGLEWPVVFIPACYDGSIPHSRAEDQDEERRLLYVGMTRAQAVLYLSSPARNTQREEATLSTFLSQPGVDAFFEEHGPSIAEKDVQSLATTLRRECPPSSDLLARRQTIEHDEDNVWPLNGEEPSEYRSRREYGNWQPNAQPARQISVFTSANVTMQQQETFSMPTEGQIPGFVSLKSRFDEAREELTLKQVDERAKQLENAKHDKPKGRKRQIENQGTIAGFFGKPTQAKVEATEKVSDFNEASAVPNQPPLKRFRQPLSQVTNDSLPAPPLLSASHNVPQRKLRTAPLSKRPGASSASNEQPKGGYVFLSSSPTKPDEEDKRGSTISVSTSREEEESVDRYQPATSMHTTTMQRLAPQRKTLGMRRSLHGWSARGGKG